MKNSQFVPAPITCPNCGFHIGEQAYFQSFEQKAASWLKGQVASVATKGYDVKGMEGFPELTFQVKYCTAKPRLTKDKTMPQLIWVWVQKTMPADNTPDFYILFGLFEDGKEHCFLLSKDDFIAGSSQESNGKYVYRTGAKKFQEVKLVGKPHKIWGYEVLNPTNNLIEAVKNYRPGKTIDWVPPVCSACNEPDRPVYGHGLCHRCYQRANPKKNRELYNEKRRAEYRALHPVSN